MTKLLANDGIDVAGKKILTDAGFEVVTNKIPQEKLSEELKNFDAILVRSATQVRRELIDAAPGLKLIGRAGVGMDNIDVAYAKEKGIHVVNTPDASSDSVAELVFAHLFTMARRLNDANRNMPGCETKEQFNELKKRCSTGIELKGKTLGIIGFGKIGQAVAKMALGIGMRVLPYKRNSEAITFELESLGLITGSSVTITMNPVPLDQLLKESDFITLHVPFPKDARPLISSVELLQMKKGVCLVNTSRGGAIAEMDLLEALNSGRVAQAALDVFEGEPLIKEALRKHSNVSLSPHIGGSTMEAQERIGIELATKVVELLKIKN